MKSHILLLSDLGSFLNTLESSVYVLSILTIPNQHQLAMKYEEFRLPFVHLLPADIVDKPSQLRIVQQLQPLSLPPFFISYPIGIPAMKPPPMVAPVELPKMPGQDSLNSDQLSLLKQIFHWRVKMTTIQSWFEMSCHRSDVQPI